MAALITDLEDRGLLDSTLIVFVGEFGRTPRISRGASAIGRDHWPHAIPGCSPEPAFPEGLSTEPLTTLLRMSGNGP
ncbi:MAG UNVERIFIED_CONTAM: DUF1501 domain-containing protein [Planctomycetaceae bacterium]